VTPTNSPAGYFFKSAIFVALFVSLFHLTHTLTILAVPQFPTHHNSQAVSETPKWLLSHQSVEQQSTLSLFPRLLAHMTATTTAAIMTGMIAGCH